MRSDVSRTVLETVLAYHERTKHHPHSYARSLGYLDWDTQPDPFRRYEGSELYHFTVGGAVDDPRLKTRPAYAHREGSSSSR